MVNEFSNFRADVPSRGSRDRLGALSISRVNLSSFSRSRSRSPSAVALIDAIVATIILGVALAVIVGLTAQAISSQSQGERMQIGAMLADEQLNLVLSRGPDDYAKAGFPLTGACDPPFESYAYALTIGGGSESEPYQVQATISWKSPSGRDERVSIQTLMAARVGVERDPIRTVPTDLTPERLE